MKYVPNEVLLKYTMLTNGLTVDELNVIEMPALERWHIFKEFISSERFDVMHFIHVPKTAGTTLSETLQFDKKKAVISVDAPLGVFFTHISLAEQLGVKVGVLSRAHHPFSLLKNSECLGHMRIIFSAYRDPKDIHISNINMIMSRLKAYYDGENLEYSIRTFCQRWASKLDSEFKYNKDFALKILGSEGYRYEMSGIYSRFFKGCTSADLDRISFLDYRDLDEIFTGAFGYKIAPPRKNVGREKILKLKDCNNSALEVLVGLDQNIVNAIKGRVINSAKLRKFFNKVKRSD